MKKHNGLVGRIFAGKPVLTTGLALVCATLFLAAPAALAEGDGSATLGASPGAALQENEAPEAPSIKLTNITTGSEEFSSSNEVAIGYLLPPESAAQWQFTMIDDQDELAPEAWSGIENPPTRITFPQPLDSATLAAYLWFLDGDDILLPTVLTGRIDYIAADHADVIAKGLDYRAGSDKDQSPAVISVGDLDDGSLSSLGLYELSISCPEDETPEESHITITAPGGYIVTLTAIDNAGFISSTNLNLTVFSTTTWWTGEIDDSWQDGGNWTDGVPSSEVGAIFGALAQRYEARYTVDSAAAFLLFKSDINSDTFEITGSASRWFSVHSPRDTIVVEENGPAVTIKTSSNRAVQIRRGQDNEIKNFSDKQLSINRISADDKGHARLYFDGTGDIEINDTILAVSGYIYLNETFSGRLIITEGATMGNWHHTTLNGGTLVLDGIRNTPQYGQTFVVNTATLTGNGRIGVANSTYPLNPSFNDGAIVDPGRPGETGVLSFENFDVRFNAGSTLRLDLASGEDYDRLLFAQTGDREGIDSIPALILDAPGVALDLRPLEGFRARTGERLEILSGFSEIQGHFDGLEDGTRINLGGYLCAIWYEQNAVVLEALSQGTIINIR